VDFRSNGEAYDVVFDAVGMQSFGRCRDSLRPGGAYLATDDLHNLALVLWTSVVGNRKVRFPIPPKYAKEDVLFLKQLIEEGHYRAVVDRRYPLDDVVAATAYVETKQKTGNVVLTVAG
jgi:NADPH:quinone reductase-like Zn-dependent oxidoreductase